MTFGWSSLRQGRALLAGYCDVVLVASCAEGCTAILSLSPLTDKLMGQCTFWIPGGAHTSEAREPSDDSTHRCRVVRRAGRSDIFKSRNFSCSINR